MLTLAVETAGRTGSVALVRDDEIVEQRFMEPARGHGGLLLAEIDALLTGHNLKPADLDLFAACAGPGSFTGVRVGLATAKALAWALGKPVAGLQSLEVLAHNALDPGIAPGIVAPVLDARKREVYGSAYRLDGSALTLIVPAVVEPPSRFLARVTEAAGGAVVHWLGSGTAEYADVFGSSALDGRIHAGILGRLAARTYAEQGVEGLAAPVARYVRPSEAEVKFGPAPDHDPLAGVDG
ncbi:MAG: tRNA threonylcarbamoyladenosine biosynthesis protein TsaB [Myxococcota bacterium]|jgi:tRNA threonylcarbamoyladenosine biosynthesis protein TsaB